MPCEEHPSIKGEHGAANAWGGKARQRGVANQNVLGGGDEKATPHDPHGVTECYPRPGTETAGVTRSQHHHHRLLSPKQTESEQVPRTNSQEQKSMRKTARHRWVSSSTQL